MPVQTLQVRQLTLSIGEIMAVLTGLASEPMSEGATEMSLMQCRCWKEEPKAQKADSFCLESR